MKHIFVLCGIVASAFSLAALDLSEYKTLDVCTLDQRNVVLTPAFDEGSEGKGWVLGKEAVISATHGRNQRGLGIQRTDPKAYSVNTQKLKLKPNTKYIAGIWIRNEGFDSKLKNCWLGTFGIEWYKGKQHLISSYENPPERDWKLYTIEFTTGKDPDLEYVIVLFVGKGRTGTASFDDVFVREVGAQWLPAVLFPHTTSLDADHAKMEIGSTILGKFSYPQKQKPQMECIASLRGETFQFTVERMGNRDNRVSFISEIPRNYPAGPDLGRHR